MSDTSGDGDLDVDAAWAEIVAHWDADDLRVVTDDEPGGDAAPGAGVGEADDAEDDDAEDGPRRGADATGRPGPAPDDWSAAAAGPPVAPHPPVPGEARPVGRSPRYDEVDDVPRLGWDAIRPPAGDADAFPPARGDAPAGGRERPEDREDPSLAALDEHFVPSDPPSLHPTDPVSSLAWLAALGGPLFLLVAALVWRDAPSVLIGAAVLAFVAGFVTLVVRMPDEREDTDDGAVV